MSFLFCGLKGQQQKEKGNVIYNPESLITSTVFVKQNITNALKMHLLSALVEMAHTYSTWQSVNPSGFQQCPAQSWSQM